MVFLKIEQNGAQICNQREKVHIKSRETEANFEKSKKTEQLIV